MRLQRYAQTTHVTWAAAARPPWQLPGRTWRLLDQQTSKLRLCTPGFLFQFLPTNLQQVTKVKLEQKQREGIAEARSGRRSVVRGILSGALQSQRWCLVGTHGYGNTCWLSA